MKLLSSQTTVLLKDYAKFAFVVYIMIKLVMGLETVSTLIILTGTFLSYLFYVVCFADCCLCYHITV